MRHLEAAEQPTEAALNLSPDENLGSSDCEPSSCDLLDMVTAVWDETLRAIPCGKCGELDAGQDMVVCDRCEAPFHVHCVPTNLPGSGPWYCQLCRGIILTRGSTDPVEDLALLDFLFRGWLPDDDLEVERVRRLSGRYRARGQELET